MKPLAALVAFSLRRSRVVTRLASQRGLCMAQSQNLVYECQDSQGDEGSDWRMLLNSSRAM